jgi:hypothetical protein
LRDSSFLIRLVFHNGDEDVRNAGGMGFAQSGELFAGHAGKQQDAAAEALAFVQRIIKRYA